MSFLVTSSSFVHVNSGLHVCIIIPIAVIVFVSSNWCFVFLIFSVISFVHCTCMATYGNACPTICAAMHAWMNGLPGWRKNVLGPCLSSRQPRRGLPSSPRGLRTTQYWCCDNTVNCTSLTTSCRGRGRKDKRSISNHIQCKFRFQNQNHPKTGKNHNTV